MFTFFVVFKNILRAWNTETGISTRSSVQSSNEELCQFRSILLQKFLDRCIVEEGDPEDENYKVCEFSSDSYALHVK